MELEELIGKFAANAGIENVQAVEGVWKFSADGNVFGVMDDDADGRVWLFGDIAATDAGRKDALATWNAIAEASRALPESANDAPPSDMSPDKFATSGFLAV